MEWNGGRYQEKWSQLPISYWRLLTQIQFWYSHVVAVEQLSQLSNFFTSWILIGCPQENEPRNGDVKKPTIKMCSPESICG